MGNQIAEAQALTEQLWPAFNASLQSKTIAELKALAKDCRANTRGCAVKKDLVRAIAQVWRSEVWDEAGYRYGPRPKRYFIS